MTFYIEPQETGLPPLQAHIPTPTDSFTRGFLLDRLERNVWDQNKKLQDQVEGEIAARLGQEFVPSLDIGDGSAARRRGRMFEAARAAAAKDPTSWGGTPLDEDQFQAEWTRRLRSQYEDATTLLDNTPDGRWGLQTGGALASNVFDPITIATAPFGAPARIGWLGAMGIEGAVNGLASAMSLPSQIEQAERLGIAAPDPATQVGLDFALGAGLGGVVHGGARLLGYGREKVGASLARRARAEDSALAWEATIQGEADALAADRERVARGGVASSGATPDLIRRFEGYRSTAYWDVNAWRVGFGSDTVTRADGTVERVTQSTVVTPEDAERDLARRIGLSEQEARAKVGPAWDGLHPDVRAALTSVAYNYGEIPDRLLLAIRGGDTDQIASAVRALGADNGGVNAGRRRIEAAVIGGDTGIDPWTGGYVDAGGTRRGYTAGDQVVTGGGRRVGVQYEVVDLASLRQATGDLQPRDRGRSNSDAWVAETAARLDPALLMPAPTADRGAPIVGPDDVIESGNGRVRAIERAYAEHPDRAAAYRAELEGAGFAVPSDVDRPVLVARRTSELDDAERRAFVVEAQDSGVAELTPVERSRAVGRQLTPERLDLADPDAAIGAPSNAGFVRAVTGTLPAGVRNRLFAGGTLTAEGKRELRQALFARAWPDRDVLERALEAEDGDGLMAALEKAAPGFAALRADIEAGRVAPEFDISPEVLDAVRMIAAARDLAARSDMPADKLLGEMLDQVDLLDGAVSPLTQALVRKFWNGGKVKPDQVAAFLRSYAAEARKAGRTGDLLSGASVADVLRTVDREAFSDLPDDFARAQPKRFGPEDATAPLPELREGGFAEGASSPEAEAGDALAAEDLRSEDGPFGPVFAGYADDPEGALARLMQERKGEVADAVVREDLGPVALVYGTPKYGLAHIEAKHPDALSEVPRLLREGALQGDPEGGAKHVFLVDDRNPPTVAALRLDWDERQKVWLASAYVDHRGKHARQVRTSDEPPASASSRVPDATGHPQDSAPAAADQAAGEALQAELAGFRDEGDDFLSMPLGDSTVGDLLDDIDEDVRLADVIAQCGLAAGLKGAGNA